MPARSFPQVPQFTQPAYRDMDAEMDRARQQWAKMRANAVQIAPEPPQIAAPFTPPVPVDVQPQSRSEHLESGLIVILVVTWIIRAIRQWKATRQRNRR